MPNSGSLCHPHTLEEAPVAHRPHPGNINVSNKFLFCDILIHALDHPTKFQPDRYKHLGGDRVPPDNRQTTGILPPHTYHACGKLLIFYTQASLASLARLGQYHENSV